MGQSINTAILMGRLTADPELKQTQSGFSVCSFRLAVDRRIKSQNGPDADFINCVVWRQGADYLCQYGFKGALTSVEGSIQTRSYKNGTAEKSNDKHYESLPRFGSPPKLQRSSKSIS